MFCAMHMDTEVLHGLADAGSACDALVKAADQADGELAVAAIGPLTNLALACQKDAGFPSKIKRLVVMGGTEGRGNITPCAEFNFFADPEAAQLVRGWAPPYYL